MSMKVNFKKGKPMAKEFINIQLVISMKEAGLMIFKMAKEYQFIAME